MFNATQPPSETENLGKDFWTISDVILEYNNTINLSIICLLISLFGIWANVINMIVFLRMGFADTINISLFGLAISDGMSLVSLLWISVCYNPYFRYSDLPIDTLALQHYPGAWTRTIFARVTGFITVFITFERCLCIAFPLKVKRILTRRRVIGVIIAIYVFTVSSMFFNYFATGIDWVWDPNRNRTILGVVVTETMERFNWVAWHMLLVYPLSSYIFVVICTFVFAWKLNHRGKWLQSATGKQERAAASRDQQVIKMVVAVAAIFIVSYIPFIFTVVAMFQVPGINVGRKYEKMYIFLSSIIFPTSAINSSVNIFIYYRMMSKYKAIFNSLFCRNKKPT